MITFASHNNVTVLKAVFKVYLDQEIPTQSSRTTPGLTVSRKNVAKINTKIKYP